MSKLHQRYASDKQLSDFLEVSRQTIWRWVREGKFPAPIKLGPNCTRWRLSDVQAWEVSREAAA